MIEKARFSGATWLMKSEPFKYSWQQFLQDGRTHWDGVRNHLAAKYLKDMRIGDRAFFYHSNEGKEIVGVMEIESTAAPDPGDDTGKFVMVGVVPLYTLPKPVSLAVIKGDTLLSGMVLIRQSRLSVTPVTPKEWQRIHHLAHS